MQSFYLFWLFGEVKELLAEKDVASFLFVSFISIKYPSSAENEALRFVSPGCGSLALF